MLSPAPEYLLETLVDGLDLPCSSCLCCLAFVSLTLFPPMLTLFPPMLTLFPPMLTLCRCYVAVAPCCCLVPSLLLHVVHAADLERSLKSILLKPSRERHTPPPVPPGKVIVRNGVWRFVSSGGTFLSCGSVSCCLSILLTIYVITCQFLPS